MRARITVRAISNDQFDHDVTVYGNGDQIVAEDSFLLASQAVIYAVDMTPNVKVIKASNSKDFIMGSTQAHIDRVKSLVVQYKRVKAACK